MHIGFMGAGRNAQTLARLMTAAGHTVTLSNSRGPDTLAGIVAGLGPGVAAGTRGQAAAADLAVLAVNWADVGTALAGIEWGGRILVDATNAHSALPPDLGPEGIARSRAALSGRPSSAVVAERAVGARLVKAFSNMPMAWIAEHRSSQEPRIAMPVAGDDGGAKRVVLGLLDTLGFAGIDLGGLEAGALFDVGGPLSGLLLHLVKRLR